MAALPQPRDQAFLGVSQSLGGRRWLGPEPSLLRRAEALVQQTGLAAPVAQVLARAGVTAAEAEAYLAPKLRDLMPDPSTLRDMDRAVDCLTAHLDRGSRIAVFADYDVDGAASAALLHAWLVEAGYPPPTIYVPDRIDEGYGPNEPAMARLAADHPLILCVDCGTVAHDPIAAAVAAGAEVLVLDHHLAGEGLPSAVATVNPNRQDEPGTLSHLCAAGVVYLVLVALNRARRAAGSSCPDLLALLDLVALATVADVAPLIGLNRALVRQGLAVMAGRSRPGLVALADRAGLSAPPTAYHLGYVLGPRINAGGRVGQADLGAQLLTAGNSGMATQLADRLDTLNMERRALEAQVTAEATAQVEARGATGPLAWAAGDGWHPGVVGIAAARLKETFDRPAVVIGFQGATGTGSGRSVPGLDLGAAVAAGAADGTLIKGGGHAMAAGLSVTRDGLDAAMAALADRLARQGAAALGPATLAIDGLLTAAAATPELVHALDAAGPFGAGMPAPRFALSAVRIAHARTVGKGHLQLRLGDATGTLDAIAFNAAEGPLGPALSAGDGAAWHIAGRLEIDDWGGRRRAKLRVEDAARA